MVTHETYLTVEGAAKLREELEHLRTVRRRAVAEGLKKAAEVGGSVDNAEYDEAKREQEAVERRIQTLEALFQHAVIIPDHDAPSETVEIGSRVTVLDEKGVQAEYTIVGSAEADPLHGRISNESPVGSAVLGKRKGQKGEAQTPTGPLKLTVVKIE